MSFFANPTRCSLVFATLLLLRSTAISADPGGISPLAGNGKTCPEKTANSFSCGARQVFVLPTDEPVPVVKNDSLHAEMLGTHNAMDEWRRAISNAIAINELTVLRCGSSILDLQSTKARYVLDPPFIESERLKSPICEVRGQPEGRSLLE